MSKRKNEAVGTSNEAVKCEKREIYLSKPDYYMGIALLAAQRSRDPSTQVGACIVNKDERIVGVGFNEMPKHTAEEKWKRNIQPDTNKGTESKDTKFLETKYAYVCHAVLNAIVNKNSFDVRGCTVYTVLFPCNECTKLITQSGISKVVYLSDSYTTRQENQEPDEVIAAKKILDIAGIKYVKFEQLSKGEKIQISLENSEARIDQGKKEEPDKQQDSNKADNPGQSKEENLLERDLNQPRTDNLSEKDYFMAVAKLSAYRSKDNVTQVGACIVSEDNKVVGIGYNGMPNGCSDDVMPWGKNKESVLDEKHPYVCHAELNAIMNKNCFDVKGCSMYVTLFPCNECAKLIVQSGIKEVFYLVDRPNKKEFIASREILETSGVKLTEFKADQMELFLDLAVKRTRIIDLE